MPTGQEDKEETEEKINAGWWASEMAEYFGKNLAETEQWLADAGQEFNPDRKLTNNEIRDILLSKVENESMIENFFQQLEQKDKIAA